MDLNMNVCPLTLNTTRICGRSSVGFATEISKIGYSNMNPNAVILINKNEVFDGIASAPLVHFPINAPILLTDPYNLTLVTLKEIQRLSPKGYNGIQVILVGNISINIINQLRIAGFTSKLITGNNHYETACKIPAERKDFKNVLIVSGEDYSEGIVSSYWSAHHGDPILFVRKNDIPYCTLNAIRKMNDINLYIIGSQKTISTTVGETLSKLANVKQLVRISGSTPYEIAVNFSKYKSPTSELGWGRNYKEGHAFSFGTLNKPMEIVTSAILAHMGKHSPLLLIKGDSVPDITSNYLKEVKPVPPMNMPRPPFMHGFILGNTSDIAFETQIKIEDIISLEH
ncbi:cell wall-binding repeat-containing protein [Clostridium estertheticum]|uniref:cell wall-binding repeat-containing protein n=1 Tax=Clostridium estertheticum TaxID=238834 RepID=UPI001C0CDD36|nr:cell wall-binding repeat-containing protein [Clostridium estertheticum]MBU3199852.1 cell wall-binding repeat-containing protein [Clostridium estertheticum]WAG67046.1 cell wall-binding repeat-containing protein [Clostridium estertheticum]